MATASDVSSRETVLDVVPPLEMVMSARLDVKVCVPIVFSG